jgi:hypothetical protein
MASIVTSPENFVKRKIRDALIPFQSMEILFEPLHLLSGRAVESFLVLFNFPFLKKDMSSNRNQRKAD